MTKIDNIQLVLLTASQQWTLIVPALESIFGVKLLHHRIVYISSKC
jgi:hypothetical protein